jgi:microcystin-dependent protein
MNNAMIGSSGGGQPHNNLQPYLVLNWIIALFGIYPSQS